MAYDLSFHNADAGCNHRLGNPAGLAEGTYNAIITLSVPGAANSPIAIPLRSLSRRR